MAWSTITGTRFDVLLRELNYAFYERALSSSPVIVTGTNIQSAGFYVGEGWRILGDGMQKRIERAALDEHTLLYKRRFIHKDTTLNSGNTDFEYYTAESFAEAAGLQYPGLWRRKVNMDDEFSYGLVQAGDILGPWIIEDLQKGLSALTRWIERGDNGEETYDWRMNKGGDSGWKSSLGEAKTAAVESWNGAGWDVANHDITASAKLLHWGDSYRAQVGRSVVYKRVSSEGGYPDGTTIKAYVQGDASAFMGTFNAFGDSGIVEGTGTETMRFVKSSVYPNDIVAFNIDGWGEVYGVQATSWDRPPWPGGEPEWPDDIGHGYGLDVTLTDDYRYLKNIYFLIEPEFTYG